MTLSEVTKALDRAEATAALLRKQEDALMAELDKAQVRRAAIDLAQALVQQVAQETQAQLRYHLQDLVQTALDAVFPGAYTFNVSFELRRGRTEVDMWLDKDGTRMDPMDSTGGGVVDVISLALRIACWAISRTDNTLILDEPFKFIRGTARARLGDMVTALSKRLQLQIIMVSDVSNTGITPDREFVISMKSRKSIVETIL